MSFGLSSTIKLNNGVEIPRLGLGVFRAAAGGEARRAVSWALEMGYRHIDTAMIYGNEGDVGEALRASGVPRGEVFITTKLWNGDHGYDAALRAFDGSLKRLRVDYLDLYLIHWPVEGRRGESWKALVKLLEEKRCRSIGVSNYTMRHLEELLKSSPVVPAVNQVELSPFLYQKELISFCQGRGIVVESYSPLTKGQRLGHPAIKSVASKYKKTPAQVMIRWALQHDLVVIPKSAKRERIEENAGVFDFEIAEADMKALDALDEGLRTSWDPTGVP
jgi:diketogulonate reductase-like aldo/keto reductase